MIETGGSDVADRLEKTGERFAVDDFGTGYSSLVYLRRLPVVEIKADRSFVTSLASVREDAVIVHAIIDLAHNLHINVVAEGVEDEETMRRGAGLLLQQAGTAEAFSEWLESSPFGETRQLATSAPRAVAAAASR